MYKLSCIYSGLNPNSDGQRLIKRSNADQTAMTSRPSKGGSDFRDLHRLLPCVDRACTAVKPKRRGMAATGEFGSGHV